MATKTEKLHQEIGRLQAENQSLFDTLQRVNKQFDDWQAQTDIDLADYMQLKGKYDTLESENSILRQKCKRLETDVAYWKAKSQDKPHNKRNAGRKAKLSEEQIAAAQMMRMQGQSFRAIAERFDCSPATIHKVCSESK